MKPRRLPAGLSNNIKEQEHLIKIARKNDSCHFTTVANRIKSYHKLKKDINISQKQIEWRKSYRALQRDEDLLSKDIYSICVEYDVQIVSDAKAFHNELVLVLGQNLNESSIKSVKNEMKKIGVELIDQFKEKEHEVKDCISIIQLLDDDVDGMSSHRNASSDIFMQHVCKLRCEVEAFASSGIHLHLASNIYQLLSSKHSSLCTAVCSTPINQCHEMLVGTYKDKQLMIKIQDAWKTIMTNEERNTFLTNLAKMRHEIITQLFERVNETINDQITFELNDRLQLLNNCRKLSEERKTGNENRCQLLEIVDDHIAQSKRESEIQIAKKKLEFYHNEKSKKLVEMQQKQKMNHQLEAIARSQRMSVNSERCVFCHDIVFS